MTITVVAGNTVRSTVTFIPESGTVLLADVTCRYLSPTGVSTSLTPVAGVVNVFRADMAIPDTEREGTGRFRWESATPKIALEDRTTQFGITGSAFPNP